MSLNVPGRTYLSDVERIFAELRRVTERWRDRQATDDPKRHDFDVWIAFTHEVPHRLRSEQPFEGAGITPSRPRRGRGVRGPA